MPGPSCRAQAPTGYRRAGSQALRVDLAERLIHAAFAERAHARAPVPMGAASCSIRRWPARWADHRQHAALLRQAGFRAAVPRPLAGDRPARPRRRCGTGARPRRWSRAARARNRWKAEGRSGPTPRPAASGAPAPLPRWR
jgi:ATP-dependent RNA helicase SUPV3L1/SUV3